MGLESVPRRTKNWRTRESNPVAKSEGYFRRALDVTARLSASGEVAASDEYRSYFDGTKLYGDDFSPDEVAQWFEDEKEGFIRLRHGQHYLYPNQALNVKYGFRFLPNRRFSRVLGLGSAYGDEFQPILSRIESITVVEPSGHYARQDIHGVPATYVKPSVDGFLPFPDDHFDLATAFGVLHHLPKVTRAVRELHRCLKPGGYLLTHEPIISMGDWRKPRSGSTKRERGIPLGILREMVSGAGFNIVREKRCCSSIASEVATLLNRPVYNSMPLVVLDAILCSILPKETKYHPTGLAEKLMVMYVFFVLQKPPTDGAVAVPIGHPPRGTVQP